jgi:hypothetical protein
MLNSLLRRIATTRRGVGLLMLCLVVAGAAVAQVGHPAKGSWLGYWGPNDKTRHRLVLNLDWRNRQIVGQFNPGPGASPVTRADIDYATWTMNVETQLPDAAGRPQKWVGTGKLENLGSWTNRVYSGTYVFGAEKGTFKLTLH